MGSCEVFRASLPKNGDRAYDRDMSIFVGRSGELHAMHDAFEQSRRILTLVGPGGVGKTSLAERFAEGWDFTRFHVDLHSASESGHVLQAVAIAVLGFATNPSIDQIAHGIPENEPVLMIFDNAELVSEEVRDVAEGLTQICPDLHVVVTSRRRLESAYESILPVQPLAKEIAAELFCQHAKQRDPTFNRQATEPDVLNLVEKLDGLPLALELAASRTRVLSPSDLLARLDDQSVVLRRRGQDERHSSLDSCVALSVVDLPEPSLNLLRQLALISGPFSLADLEKLLGGLEPLDYVEELVERSLLQAQSGSQRRFRVLDTIRRFVLHAHPPTHNMVVDWGEWLLEKLQSHAPEMLEHLLPQVSRAFAHLIEDDASLAVELLLAAERPLRRAGSLHRVQSMFDAALQNDGLTDRERAHINVARGSLLTNLGAVDDAELVLEKAFSLLPDELENRELRARIFQTRGWLFLGRGEFDDAWDSFEESLNTVPGDADPGLVAHIYGGQTIVCLHHRDPDRAVELAESALDHASRSPDPAQRGRAMGWKANALAASGRFQETALLLKDSLRHFQRASDIASLSNHGLTLAELKLGMGQTDIEDVLEVALPATKIWGAWISQSRALAIEARLNSDLEQAKWAAESVQNLSYYPQRSVLLTLAMIQIEHGEFAAAIITLQTLINSTSDPLEQRWLRGYLIAVKLADNSLRDVDDERLSVSGKSSENQLVVGSYEEFVDPFFRCEYAFHAEPASLIFGGMDLRKTLRIDSEFKEYVLPDQAELSLATRHTLRRFLRFMIERHLESPGRVLELAELMEGGWPEESMTYDSGSQRVYAAIKQLRKAGFGDVVVTGDGGYLIDKELEIEFC